MAGYDYQEGGSIGWSGDNFTSGIKSGLINMTVSSALGGVDILEDNKWASAGITGFVNAGVDTSGDWNDLGWNDSKDAVAAGIAAGAASYASGRLASQQESSTDGQGRNILGLGKSDFGGDFSKGGYANKLIYNTINSGLLSMYNMAEHDLSWDDASRQSGFYSGMIYDHRDLSGFVGSKVGAKLQSSYQDYRDHRAKKEQQEKAGLPVDAEDPFNGAEEMLFGLMDGLKRTEESFSNLFSGDGFNTDADLNNMDWETYDGYMKTVETGGADLAEYLQAKMRTGQELSYPEKQAVAQMAGSYGAGSMVAGFNGDYRHETDGQMAILDSMGYDTEGLKGQVGQMRAVDSYNKAVRAAEDIAYFESVKDPLPLSTMIINNNSRINAGIWTVTMANRYGGGDQPYGGNSVAKNPDGEIRSTEGLSREYQAYIDARHTYDQGIHKSGVLPYFSASAILASKGIEKGTSNFLKSIPNFLFNTVPDIGNSVMQFLTTGSFNTQSVVNKVDSTAYQMVEGIVGQAEYALTNSPEEFWEVGSQVGLDFAMAGLFGKAKKNSSLTYVAKSADTVDLSYDISKWKEYGLPADGYFGKMVRYEDAVAFTKGEVIDLAGNSGTGFISKADELLGVTTSAKMKEAMAVPYSPDYLLEFQLKSPQGLHNLLQHNDPFFRVGGKTLTGYSEYNFKGLTSDNIINWRIRKLKK